MNPPPGHEEGDRVRGEIARAERAVMPAWRRVTHGENRLPMAAAVVVAIVLQLSLPDRLGLRPRWLLPVLEAALLVLLTVLNPVRLTRVTTAGRYASLLLVAVITVDNTFSAVALDADIIGGHSSKNASSLLASGAAIYLTNIVAFAIWYWDFDRGGPFERANASRQHLDFLFPQMTTPELVSPDWEPTFVDYLYTAFTNATAFSPTDTMPLSRWAKVLMAAQSAVALSTTALVVARAINILQ